MTNSNHHHLVRTAEQADFKVPAAYASLSKGFTRWSVVNRDNGSVHQEFNLCELAPGGSVDAHLHTFEESIYIMSGQLVCETGEGIYLLQEGDYGVIPVGAPHAYRNPGTVPARWAETLAPQPRVVSNGDVYSVKTPTRPSTDNPIRVDARDPRTRSFGHISPDNMDPTKQTQNLLAASASMRTALLVYSGISLKMMVDTDLGAQNSTLFMVQYEPGGLASPHDHPLEETYMITAGEVDAVFDGMPYRLKPGDIAWAGVGCIHEFKNSTDGIVRWLENQVPQPPRRHAYRFRRDWNYFEEALKKEGQA